ncbi:tRNA 2-thiouridine(34) synthase MnmA [bacterium]|nr:tRNA 2-thiouridine(34) synthase MnmA [bacterium]
MIQLAQKQKIYVAMSGGVDSAVVAALLVKAGYDVTGVYMKNWADNFGISARCPWEDDLEDVKKVAEHLGIPYRVYNFEKEYKERILDYFFAEYKAGRTPNPDILCNNLVKFDLFAERAFSEGATHIATGHYARREIDQGFSWEKQGKLGLYTALDSTKDQAYFLQRLSKEQLERAIFPLGNYYKSEVRALAKDFKLPNAEKKDSQGICFIGDIDVRDFIREHLQTNPGNIIDDETGLIVGKHQGLWFYTIGQRQGIGVSSASEPYFVVDKRSESNELVIAKGHDNLRLLKQEVRIGQIHAISGQFFEGQEVAVSLRYREKPLLAKIKNYVNGKGTLVSQTEKSFWAPAAGQGALLFNRENIENLSEKADKITNTQVLYKYFTESETRSGIRAVEILGGGVLVE